MCVSSSSSSQSEGSCSSRFNQRVYHCVSSSSSSCLTAECSTANFLFFFFSLLDLFVCACVCVCVCVSQTEDQHNVFDVLLSLFFRFALFLSFFSYYILTYLKYTLNSLYKEIVERSNFGESFDPLKDLLIRMMIVLTMIQTMSLLTM